MGAQKSAAHGGDHHSDDNLLQFIAAKERELEALTAAARNEAASIVTQARAEAERVLREAREQAVRLARESEQQVASEVARVQADADRRATDEVAALRKQAADRKEKAVRLVVEHILRGTDA